MGSLKANSIEYLDIVIDEILPKLIISLNKFDAQTVVNNGISLVESVRGQVLELDTEKEFGANLDHMIKTLMLNLD